MDDKKNELRFSVTKHMDFQELVNWVHSLKEPEGATLTLDIYGDVQMLPGGTVTFNADKTVTIEVPFAPRERKAN